MVTTFQKDANDIPTQKVVAMRKQNLSDNQIIQALQKEGYDSQNVLEALEMADMGHMSPSVSSPVPQTPLSNTPQSIAQEGSSSSFSSPSQHMTNSSSPQSFQQASQGMPPPMGVSPSSSPQSFQQAMPSQNMSSQNQMPGRSDDDVEELIEAIIDEKWAEVEKDINRVIEWKDTVDEKMGSMQEDIKELKKDFDELHKAILGKVGEYDKNILNVGTQLKAMEQVFSKVLPTFTDNVSELTRIADKLKKS